VLELWPGWPLVGGGRQYVAGGGGGYYLAGGGCGNHIGDPPHGITCVGLV
jgi:hypothetical protein